MPKKSPTINLREPWEEVEEEVPPPLEEDKPEEVEPTASEVEEEQEVNNADNSKVEEPPEPEPPKAEEGKKKEEPLVRHIIPIDPDLAEQMWGRPLTPEQRQRLEEDWRLGFRQLTDEERRFCGISKDPETYARMESLSKNYLKVSTQQGKDDLIELELTAQHYGWLKGYLRDENGRFTDRCVYELMQYRRRMREWILPEEPDGSIDLTKYKRGDLAPKRGIRVKNPRYGERFDYQAALADRARRWRTWKDERDRGVPTVVEVVGEPVFGELIVTPQTKTQHEEQLSLLQQRLEGLASALCAVPAELKDPIWEQVEPFWSELGLRLRVDGIARSLQVMKTGKVKNADESTEPQQSDEQPSNGELDSDQGTPQ